MDEVSIVPRAMAPLLEPIWSHGGAAFVCHNRQVVGTPLLNLFFGVTVLWTWWVARRLTPPLWVALWLTATAALASSGVLSDFSARPPKFMLLMGLTTVATAALATSSLGTRLVAKRSMAELVGFQVFRIPVEVFLTWAAREGVAPT